MNNMDEKLRNTIQWSLYIVVALVALLTLFALVVVMIAPTFFPAYDVSGFKDYLTVSSVILSFLSAGLGLFSIIQALSSNKQSIDILKGIRHIESSQEIIANDILSMKSRNISRGSANNSKWSNDEDES